MFIIENNIFKVYYTLDPAIIINIPLECTTICLNSTKIFEENNYNQVKDFFSKIPSHIIRLDLGQYNFDNYPIPSNQINTIKKVISSIPDSIKILNLTNSLKYVCKLEEICKAIPKNIEILNLSDNDLTSIQNLGQCLASIDDSIKILDLSKNDLGTASNLAQHFRYLPSTVIELNLSKNELSKQSIANLKELVSSLNVNTLNLSKNGFFNSFNNIKSGMELAEVFKSLSNSITSLNLSSNGGGAFEDLPIAIENIPPQVINLNLSNMVCNIKIKKRIINAVPFTVKYINIGYSDLFNTRPENISEILQSLKCSTVDLSGHDRAINYDVIKYMSKSVTTLILKQWSLGGYIVTADLQILCKALAQTNVTTLDLSNNYFHRRSPENLSMFLNLLPQNIEKVILQNNELFSNEPTKTDSYLLEFKKLKNAKPYLEIDISQNGETNIGHLVAPLVSKNRYPIEQKITDNIFSFLNSKEVQENCINNIEQEQHQEQSQNTTVHANQGNPCLKFILDFLQSIYNILINFFNSLKNICKSPNLQEVEETENNLTTTLLPC